MKQKLVPILLTLIALISLGTLTNAQEPDFQAMLATIDERSNFAGDLAMNLLIEQVDPVDGDENLKVQMFRRDTDDLFLLLIQKPETQLGQGYLRVDESLWFYDPESRQFQFTSLAESFEGSDARNSDWEASSFASYFPSYAKAGDNFIADKAIYIDELVEGAKTTITFSDLSVAEIPDNVFTKAYVERVNR